MTTRVAVLPVPFPPLDRARCERCDRVGVHVVAMWTTPAPECVPCEALYCTTECAAFAGWPWLGIEGGAERA